jgi:hypothetical protein
MALSNAIAAPHVKFEQMWVGVSGYGYVHLTIRAKDWA